VLQQNTVATAREVRVGDDLWFGLHPPCTNKVAIRPEGAKFCCMFAGKEQTPHVDQKYGDDKADGPTNPKPLQRSATLPFEPWKNWEKSARAWITWHYAGDRFRTREFVNCN